MDIMEIIDTLRDISVSLDRTLGPSKLLSPEACQRSEDLGFEVSKRVRADLRQGERE